MINLLFPSFILTFFGLVNLFGIDINFFSRQIFAVFIGIIIFILVKKIGKFFFIENSLFFYWLFVAILILTYIIGLEIKGSRRWLDLYFFQFQPSEIFKVFFILHLAKIFTEKKINYRLQFLKSLIYFFIPTLIIFKQPDLGNALVYFFIYFILLFFSKIPKKIIFQMIILIIFLTPLLWLVMASYQKARIIAFLNPNIDKMGISYNINQAIITIGSGRFFGKGMGLGTQSKLHFLPENKTDFAFASLIEQFGFFGGLIVILSYGIIFYFLTKRILKRINSEKEENFFYYLGVLSFVFIQFLINVGMNLGLMPIAGITLPFISYGGTSIITLFLAFSLL